MGWAVTLLVVAGCASKKETASNVPVFNPDAVSVNSIYIIFVDLCELCVRFLLINIHFF